MGLSLREYDIYTLTNIDPKSMRIYKPTIIVECRVWAAIDDSIAGEVKTAINEQLLTNRNLKPDDFDYM